MAWFQIKVGSCYPDDYQISAAVETFRWLRQSGIFTVWIYKSQNYSFQHLSQIFKTRHNSCFCKYYICVYKKITSAVTDWSISQHNYTFPLGWSHTWVTSILQPPLKFAHTDLYNVQIETLDCMDLICTSQSALHVLCVQYTKEKEHDYLAPEDLKVCFYFWTSLECVLVMAKKATITQRYSSLSTHKSPFFLRYVLSTVIQIWPWKRKIIEPVDLKPKWLKILKITFSICIVLSSLHLIT